MNRAEHLKWAKERAMEYVNMNDNQQAFGSFLSDMGKHEELANHIGLDLGMSLLIGGHLSSKQQMKEWITGFN